MKMRLCILLSLVAATAGQRAQADHVERLEAAKAAGARIPAWAIAKARRNHQRAQAAARREGTAEALRDAAAANETITREAPLVAEFSKTCATERPTLPYRLTARGARMVFEAAAKASRYFEWGPGGGEENFPRAMAKPGKVVSVDYRPGCASRGLGKCLAERRCVATGDLIDGHPAKWYGNQSESDSPPSCRTRRRSAAPTPHLMSSSSPGGSASRACWRRTPSRAASFSYFRPSGTSRSTSPATSSRRRAVRCPTSRAHKRSRPKARSSSGSGTTRLS